MRSRCRFPDQHFDVAVCTQVYEYVEDIAAALAEARRVLRSGGRLLVLDTDWDSIVWHSGDRGRMNRVLAAWNEHLADLPRRLPRLLRAAGLEPTESAIIPILNVGADLETLSAGMIGLVAGYVPGPPTRVRMRCSVLHRTTERSSSGLSTPEALSSTPSSGLPTASSAGLWLPKPSTYEPAPPRPSMTARHAKGWSSLASSATTDERTRPAPRRVVAPGRRLD